MKISLTKRIPYKLYDIIQDIRNNGVHQINHGHEQSKSQFIEYDLNKILISWLSGIFSRMLSGFRCVIGSAKTLFRWSELESGSDRTSIVRDMFNLKTIFFSRIDS